MATLLSYVGWAVLPNYATSIVQSIYYGITIRAGEPKPQPGSPLYARHRRRIYITVVTAYLLYSLFEVFHRIQVDGDFYQALGVSPLADARTIKTRFRRLAAQHHPDKLGQGVGSDDYFMYLKTVQDALVDPAKRFAYNLRGRNVLDWPEKETAYAYFVTGLQKSIIGYLLGFLMVLFLNFVWWPDWGRYWRFYTYAALFALDFALATRKGAVFFPSFLPFGLRDSVSGGFYLLPFQIQSLAQSVSMTTHIFISQLTPPDAKKGPGAGERLRPQTMERLGQLLQLTRATDSEATRLLQLGLAPFQGDRESVATLRKGMKEGLVLSSVRASPGVQQAVKEVVERRNQEKKNH